MKIEPLSGTLFLFYNRTKTSFKILLYDGQGFYLIQKRLSKGSFKHLPLKNTSTGKTEPSPYSKVCHRTLAVLINNGDPNAAKFPKDWRPIEASKS